jgi:undecaprenyl pyrophosphate phosphatase UppP
VLELGDPEVLAGMSADAWLGALAAFFTGYLALHLLKGVLRRGQFWLFALYLVPLAAAMMVLGSSSR